ncbi:MAG: type IV toxin-antitoxin system AbiEi family antitoxin domain-containing protein [Bacilli bacterium]|nr:type IV toxin-antitoxin system AbiEi family antitoxin domain-containing protein [Bacilli bacterium]
MIEKCNYQKLEAIFKKNGGFITREDVDKAGVNSWFLSDFVRKKNLQRIAPGLYADESYPPDDHAIIQRRYPKYIFSGLSALYLHRLTDKIPAKLEVTSPQNYNPSRKRIAGLSVRKISDPDIYHLGISLSKTIFGNSVKVYDEERTICDVIKYRDKYDAETFVKAIKLYIRRTNNQVKLFRYARMIGIEKETFELLEVINNED